VCETDALIIVAVEFKCVANSIRISVRIEENERNVRQSYIIQDAELKSDQVKLWSLPLQLHSHRSI
jgi:hypothetical protein